MPRRVHHPRMRARCTSCLPTRRRGGDAPPAPSIRTVSTTDSRCELAGDHHRVLRHARAVGVRKRLRASASAGSSQSVVVGLGGALFSKHARPPLRRVRMDVRAVLVDDAPIDTPVLVQAHMQGTQGPVEKPLARPSSVASVDRLPMPVAIRHVTPLRPGVEHPEHPVEECAVIGQ